MHKCTASLLLVQRKKWWKQKKIREIGKTEKVVSEIMKAKSFMTTFFHRGWCTVIFFSWSKCAPVFEKIKNHIWNKQSFPICIHSYTSIVINLIQFSSIILLSTSPIHHSILIINSIVSNTISILHTNLQSKRYE